MFVCTVGACLMHPAKVEGSLGAIDASWLVSVRKTMQDSLLHEAMQEDDLKLRLDQIREVFPPSIERDSLVADQLEAVQWIDAHVLEDNRPQSIASSHDATTLIFQFLVGCYPGSMKPLVHLFDGRVTSKELVQQMGLTDTAAAASLLKTLDKLNGIFQGLAPAIQRHVLQEALTFAIASLPKIKPDGPETPYELYVQAVNRDLLGPLRQDARISESIIEQVKLVFLAFPAHIQSRVLLTALRHPNAATATATSATAQPDSDAVGEIVRDLLSAGGVVAVKLAQMIAEDPKVPPNYRSLLGSLRDDNEAMSAPEFWHSLPTSLRARLRGLGPILGTGSVKQVHRVEFTEGTKQPLVQQQQQQQFAIAALRKRVEDEALASLDALAASEDLQTIASRLGRLVYGEFNLFNEGETLQDFATTSIGQHPLLRVVRVAHHSPKCLVEEIAEGPTVAKGIDRAGEKERARILEILRQYHMAVMTAFMEEGLIHSDIHLGNAVVETDPESGALTFALFDVGQFERMNRPDTDALLWALSWMSEPVRFVTLRRVALRHLGAVATLNVPDDFDWGANLSSPAMVMESRLEQSFNEAVAADSEGNMPDLKMRYMLFLRNCENNGVVLPQGAFALAKLLDGILSQQNSYGIPSVADVCIERHLRSSIGLADVYDLSMSQLGL